MFRGAGAHASTRYSRIEPETPVQAHTQLGKRRPTGFHQGKVGEGYMESLSLVPYNHVRITMISEQEHN